MIVVREFKNGDMPWMLEQAKQFFKYHPHDLKFDPVHVLKLLMGLRDTGILLIAERDGVKLGAIGGLYNPNVFDPNFVILTELFLWVDKQHRKTRAVHHLIKAFKERRSHADSVALCHTSLTPSMGRLYERNGLRLLESTYTQED